MPTAAKLSGAILFGLLAWLVSARLREVLPGGGGMALFGPLNAALGALIGWRIMGGRAGEGLVPAIGYGLTTVFAITFWAVLLWSGYMMLDQAIHGRFSGPLDALQGMATLMVENARLLIVPGVVGTAVIGGLICALVTEMVSRRWP